MSERKKYLNEKEMVEELGDSDTLRFLRRFKEELARTFEEPMETERAWKNVMGTCGWYNALLIASSAEMPEIGALYNKLDWWASDKLDAWIIECAVWDWIIEQGSGYTHREKKKEVIESAD